ncbi:hypothetical protein A2U01_0085867, partial [Trifolium medium]|nr:hypothetical protein [Trifolium medium]
VEELRKHFPSLNPLQRAFLTMLESLDHLLVVDVPAILKSEKLQSEFEGDLTAASKK